MSDSMERYYYPTITEAPHKDSGPSRAERKEDSPVAKWVEEVRREVNEGRASAFVHARTNVDIEKREGQYAVVVTKNFSIGGGYQDVLHRNIDKGTSSKYKSSIDLVTDSNYYDRKERDIKVPDYMSRDKDVLYVTVLDSRHIHPNRKDHKKTIEEVAGDRNVIEIAYAQPKADSSARTSEKSLYLTVPKETSDRLVAHINSGDINPNDLRDMAARIFVDGQAGQFYDTSVIDKTRGNIVPDKPDLNKIYLSVSQFEPDNNKYKYSSGSSRLIEYTPKPVDTTPALPVAPTTPDVIPPDEVDPGLPVTDASAAFPDLIIPGSENDERYYGARTNNEEDAMNAPLPIDTVLPPDDRVSNPVAVESRVDVLPSTSTPDVFSRLPLNWSEDDLQRRTPVELLTGIERKSREEQLRITRALMDRIESNRLRIRDGENMTVVQPLRTAMEQDRLESSVRKEIETRIRLKETTAIVSTLTANSEFVINGYRGAVSEAFTQNLLLTPEDFDVLFAVDGTVDKKESMNGIPVRAAFNYLQSVAFNGEKVMVNGKQETLKFGSRMSDVTKSEMRSTMIRKISEANRISEKEARKALQLAESIADSTFESTIWNAENVYHTPLSACVYFYDFRNSQDPNDRGPIVTQPWIEGFGTSFFRQLEAEVGGKKRHFFNDEIRRDVKNARTVFEAEVHMRKADRLLTDKSNWRIKRRLVEYLEYKPNGFRGKRVMQNDDYNQTQEDFILNVGREGIRNPQDKTYRNMASNAYFSYLNSYIPKILQTQDLLLKQDWTTKDFTPDNVSKWIGIFKKSDPDGRLALKYFFAGGAIDDMLTFGAVQGVSRTEIENIVFKSLLAPHSGIGSDFDFSFGSVNQASFITTEQADGIRNSLKTNRRGIANAVLLKLSGYIETTGRR